MRRIDENVWGIMPGEASEDQPCPKSLEPIRYLLDYATPCPECPDGWLLFRGVVYVIEGQPLVLTGIACATCESTFTIEVEDVVCHRDGTEFSEIH